MTYEPPRRFWSTAAAGFKWVIGPALREAWKVNPTMQESQVFHDHLKAYMSSRNAVLPVFSATGMKIQAEAAKDDPDTAVIESMINRDPSLTSQVLRIGNSVFYKGVERVTTVAGAIMRLGSREIANMAILISQRSQFNARDHLANTLMQNLWRHSVGVAIASQWLVGRCRLDLNAQEAFTAGLLHDMGKLLLLTVTDGALKSGHLPKMPAAGLLFDFLNAQHCIYGYALLRQWRIPETYCLVARDHHNPEPDENDALMMVIRLADMATNCLGIGLRQPEDCHPDQSREATLLQLDEADLQDLSKRLDDTKVFW